MSASGPFPGQPPRKRCQRKKRSPKLKQDGKPDPAAARQHSPPPPSDIAARAMTGQVDAYAIQNAKNIYKNLVRVENECIALGKNFYDQYLDDNGQWEAFIRLFQDLLDEHHDFFGAIQQAYDESSMQSLTAKLEMPERIWRHGIHPFLEFMRKHLPISSEYMLRFIYFSYHFLISLVENVPGFSCTWMEYLGDLARYPTVIGDVGRLDRETWAAVSRSWFSKLSAATPSTGRFYHHLGVLTGCDRLERLFYYAKSLCVPAPFTQAKESIATLFDCIMVSNSQHAVEVAFFRVHGALFSAKFRDRLKPSEAAFLKGLSDSISLQGTKWLETGYFIGIILSCSLLGYGSGSNPLKAALSECEEKTKVADKEWADETFHEARSFFTRTVRVVLSYRGAANTLTCIHTVLVFMLHLSQHARATSLIEDSFPWIATAEMLNSVLQALRSERLKCPGDFPRRTENGELRPFPEDYALRGFSWSEEYFPSDWFSNDRLERLLKNDKLLTSGSSPVVRWQRIAFLGKKLAKNRTGLSWNEETEEFSATPSADGDK